MAQQFDIGERIVCVDAEGNGLLKRDAEYIVTDLHLVPSFVGINVMQRLGFNQFLAWRFKAKPLEAV